METVALRRAAERADTSSAPVRVSLAPVTDALAVAMSLPPNAVEMSGSASSASTRLKRRFWLAHPIELNARTKEAPVSPLRRALATVASMPVVNSASTVRLAPVTSAVTEAVASARTTLVAAIPPTARTLPAPRKLPPSAATMDSTSALMVPSPSASTSTAPLAVTGAARVAVVRERTSLVTMMMPTARAEVAARLRPDASVMPGKRASSPLWFVAGTSRVQPVAVA